MDAITDPSLYYIIGKRNNLDAAADNLADRVMFTALSEIAKNHLLAAYAPDGLILQRAGECFITDRMRLVPFSPARGDWTNAVKERPAPEPTTLEWHELIEDACKEFAADPRHSSHMARTV